MVYDDDRAPRPKDRIGLHDEEWVVAEKEAADLTALVRGDTARTQKDALDALDEALSELKKMKRL